VLRATRQGELLDRAFARRVEQVPPRDRAWLHELVYGTLRLRARLDHLLAGHVRRGLESLDADVLDALRLGAYQIREMSSVPVYAAVSQTVELARDAGARRAAGLVNGVLQSLARSPADAVAFPDPDREPAAHLASWGSHPGWLVERWIAQHGPEAARAIVELNNRRPELYVRPIGMETAAAVAALAAAGLTAEPVPGAPDSLRIAPPGTAAAALAAVPAVVQDPAAAQVVRYADVPAAGTVLDLCAAPGGKALGLAAGGAFTVAADVSPSRLGRLLENAGRIGGVRLCAVAADARLPPFRPAEAVLVDVPCTGTGTLRRHPDGRWRVGPGDLAALVVLQREIMEAAAPLVAPGGVLVYSTCSLEREENEEQVEWFLSRFPGFVTAPPDTVTPDQLDERGRLKILPPTLGADGAFAARLRHIGG
jgi:16S rRNA (cytosine967-C5)-methyltransferase